MAFDLQRIKSTHKGYSYVEVTPKEIINWGGGCICDRCNETFLKDNMILCYTLHDIFCKKCWKEIVKMMENELSDEEIKFDIEQQMTNQNDIKYYKSYLGGGRR